MADDVNKDGKIHGGHGSSSQLGRITGDIDAPSPMDRDKDNGKDNPDPKGSPSPSPSGDH